MPTCILVLGVFTAYFITIVIFAGLYLTVNKVGIYYDGDDSGTHGSDKTSFTTEESDMNLIETSGDPSFCGMDINNHMEALYFSLSTMATIGYGTSDYYFGECWTPFILVLLQVFSAIVFSSLAIGLLFLSLGTAWNSTEQHGIVQNSTEQVFTKRVHNGALCTKLVANIIK